MSRDALVVGINTYQSPRLRNLDASAFDAEAIATLLEKHGDFSVWRLPEAVNKNDNSLYVGKQTKVSLTQLKKALVQLFKPEGKNIPDTALFYFSGHGLRETLGIPQGFLATSDANPNDEKWGISLKWLRELLQESPIKQQIIWLDCCHSGELLNFSEADPGEQGLTRDRCFIAASREFELAYENLGDHYSVLTKVLLKGLDPKRTPTQWITNYSLVEYINQNLVETIQRPSYSNFGSPINLTHSWEAEFFMTKSLKSQRINRLKSLVLFLLIPLVGTLIGGYFIIREIQLNSDKQLIAECLGKKYCHGRIEALERLVQANRSLKSYNLNNANLESAYLREANLELAYLREANLELAYLGGADLFNTNLEGADLFNTNLEGANLVIANLREANLELANLEGANLAIANLRGAYLGDANLGDAYLGDAYLEGANLREANLREANLREAELFNTNLEGANLIDANLIDTKNLTHSQIKTSCNWQQAYYKGSWDNVKQEWLIDQEANQAFIEAVKADKASDPKEPPDCSKWEKKPTIIQRFFLAWPRPVAISPLPTLSTKDAQTIPVRLFYSS